MPSKQPATTPTVRVRSPLDDVPDGDFTKTGFGLHRNTEAVRKSRLSAVRAVREALLGEEMPDPGVKVLDAFNVVKGLFEDVAAADTADWYLTSKMLGHPSSELAAVIADNFHKARMAIAFQSDDEYDPAADFLSVHEPVVEMLDTYVGVEGEKKKYIEEKDWAFILWSTTLGKTFAAGATDTTIENMMERLQGRLTSGAFGAIATWLVHDVDDARTVISETLAPYAKAKGFYETGIGAAKAAVSEALIKHDLLVHSPWHIEEEPKVPVPPLRSPQ